MNWSLEMQSVGVVITGGAGGVGFAYADEFVRRGHKVVICDVKDPDAAVQVQSTSGFFAFCCVVCVFVVHNASDVRVDSHPQAIRQKHEGGKGRIYGTVTDVSSAQSVEALAAFSKEHLGTVHYWINNAGINGGRRPLTEVPAKGIEEVVKVNLVGVLLCTRVAIQLLQTQPGEYADAQNAPGKTRREKNNPRPN